MALGGCGQICKWIVILFNILFILLGLGLLFGALYLLFTAPEELKTSHFVFMVGLCTSIGVVILITAAVGDYGSCSENKSALSAYCSLLFLLACAAAIGGGVAFVNNSDFSEHVGNFYANIYGQYLVRGDVIRAFILKLFHRAFDCCGLGAAIQTITGNTKICPQETNFLGISVSTSSSCLPLITDSLEASSVLTFFLVIAGILVHVHVPASYKPESDRLEGQPWRQRTFLRACVSSTEGEQSHMLSRPAGWGSLDLPPDPRVGRHRTVTETPVGEPVRCNLTHSETPINEPDILDRTYSETLGKEPKFSDVTHTETSNSEPVEQDGTLTVQTSASTTPDHSPNQNLTSCLT